MYCYVRTVFNIIYLYYILLKRLYLLFTQNTIEDEGALVSDPSGSSQSEIAQAKEVASVQSC